MLSELSDSRELFEAVLKAMADMVLVFDDDGRLIYYNIPEDSTLCLPQEQLLGMRYREVIGEELGPQVEAALDATRRGVVGKVEYRLETTKGLRWFSAQMSPIVENERYMGSVAVVHDIDDYKRALKDLKLAGILFESTIEGICVCNPEGTIRAVNPAFTAITGYAAVDVIGHNPRLLKSDRHDKEFYQEMWSSLTKAGSWQGEIWNRRKSGETYPEFLAINEVRDRSGKLNYYVGVFTDLSEIKLRDDLIRHQTYHDPLTGLPNRELLEDRLKVAARLHGRREEVFAVVMLDLDNFKQVNNSLGHAVGDQLLRLVAERLVGCMRESDTVARMGADRFVMLLLPPGVRGVNDVLAAVRRVQACFAKPFVCEEQEIYVSASMGLALFPSDGRDGLTLLKHADQAIVHARSQGKKSSYSFYSDEMNASVTRRFALENELHNALAQNQFEIFYQPVVEAPSGVIRGAEALIRWRHPERGLVPPNEFIPLAEENGLITSITEWVLIKVLEDLKLIPEISISINISARDLAGDRLEKALESNIWPGAADRLVFELTENTLVDRRESVLQTMGRLRRSGVRFSIDDFGTGYSSLSYLKRFPLDYLKIDRSFVIDLPLDDESCGIVHAIIGLGKALDLELIAEGVETHHQLEFLASEGCQYIQGYYFSKPVPLADFLKLPQVIERPEPGQGS